MFNPIREVELPGSVTSSTANFGYLTRKQETMTEVDILGEDNLITRDGTKAR